MRWDRWSTMGVELVSLSTAFRLPSSGMECVVNNRHQQSISTVVINSRYQQSLSTNQHHYRDHYQHHYPALIRGASRPFLPSNLPPNSPFRLDPLPTASIEHILAMKSKTLSPQVRGIPLAKLSISDFVGMPKDKAHSLNIGVVEIMILNLCDKCAETKLKWILSEAMAAGKCSRTGEAPQRIVLETESGTDYQLVSPVHDGEDGASLDEIEKLLIWQSTLFASTLRRYNLLQALLDRDALVEPLDWRACSFTFIRKVLVGVFWKSPGTLKLEPPAPPSSNSVLTPIAGVSRAALPLSARIINSKPQPPHLSIDLAEATDRASSVLRGGLSPLSPFSPLCHQYYYTLASVALSPSKTAFGHAEDWTASRKESFAVTPGAGPDRERLHPHGASKSLEKEHISVPQVQHNAIQRY
ncbi:uncharacterized protein BJ171DRAFT_507281 [Polychytrium aggregatum]|uniref:uncharacterized protein n=1 Tax=Polychytrium aggregatum TaxID=110093 RepID=UPI0022FE05D5|nr:uncharacterized protein BJ171DRAFT_507281 [Polychytrium aggregatum]KAI9203986.1 hypothetical protein BJ171DRAFT_507281 [Polychytrium aggregatum]